MCVLNSDFYRGVTKIQNFNGNKASNDRMFLILEETISYTKRTRFRTKLAKSCSFCVRNSLLEDQKHSIVSKMRLLTNTPFVHLTSKHQRLEFIIIANNNVTILNNLVWSTQNIVKKPKSFNNLGDT